MLAILIVLVAATVVAIIVRAGHLDRMRIAAHWDPADAPPNAVFPVQQGEAKKPLSVDAYARLDIPRHVVTVQDGCGYDCLVCDRIIQGNDRCIEAGRNGNLHFCDVECFKHWQEQTETAKSEGDNGDE